VPRDRPYVFLSKSSELLRHPVLFWYLPFDLRNHREGSLRQLSFIGGNWRGPATCWSDRSNPGPSAFRQVSELMTARRSLVVFPRARAAPMGGSARSGRIFRMAIESKLLIVPVAVRGSRRVMRKNELTTRPARVVEVFDPIRNRLAHTGRRQGARQPRARGGGGGVAGDEDAAPGPTA